MSAPERDSPTSVVSSDGSVVSDKFGGDLDGSTLPAASAFGVTVDSAMPVNPA